MSKMTDDARAGSFREERRALINAGDVARLEKEILAFDNPRLPLRQNWLETVLNASQAGQMAILNLALQRVELTVDEASVALRGAASAGQCRAMARLHELGADALWMPRVADPAQVPANLVGVAGTGGHVEAMMLARAWEVPVQVEDLRRIAAAGRLDALVALRQAGVVFPPDLHLSAVAGYAFWEPGHRGQLFSRGQKFVETVAFTLAQGGDPWRADAQQRTGLTIGVQMKDARLQEIYLNAMT